MLEMLISLFAWMPPVLAVIVIGALAIFFIITLLRFIQFVLDLIPFL